MAGRSQWSIEAEVTKPIPPLTGAKKAQQITFANANPVALNGGLASNGVSLDIQAAAANAGTVYIGTATVQNLALLKGQTYSGSGSIVENVAEVYVKGTAGDVVNVQWLEVTAA